MTHGLGQDRLVTILGFQVTTCTPTLHPCHYVTGIDGLLFRGINGVF